MLVHLGYPMLMRMPGVHFGHDHLKKVYSSLMLENVAAALRGATGIQD